MWFIFPQLRGLGVSATSEHYGLADISEAQAYLAHPLLGSRLVACTKAVLTVQGRTLHEIFGTPDDMKFRSCMTLFAMAAGSRLHLFNIALDRYCQGEADPRTVALLAQ